MRNRLLRRIALATGAVVVIFLLIPAAILGLSLMRARHSFDTANSALRSDNLALARERLGSAVSSASSAATVSEGPFLNGVATLIGVDDDLSALGTLAEVLTDTARAAAAVLDQAGAEESLAATLYRDGRIDIPTVHRLEGAVASLGDVLARARTRLDAVSALSLRPVEDALERAGDEISDISPTVDKAASVLGLLPGLAGEGGQRRYLLAFQSPSEARGGGGLIGVYGILEARDGRLSLDRVGPIEELVARMGGAVEAPEWFEDLYGRLLGTRDFRMANLSPHFPTTAQVWLRMYRRAAGEHLDGVIALDPFALGELTAGTGPLSAEGWDREINRTNVRRVLLHDVYRHFDLKERVQNVYLHNLIDVLWARLESADLRVGPTLRGVGEAARKQRIKMFSLDPSEEAVLSELGVSGDYTTAGPSMQMLFHNNFAANKVDYFLHRSIHSSVSLQDDGSAEVEVEVTLDNDAPREEGSVLVRPHSDELPTGINDMVLSLLMPRGATATRLVIDGADTGILRGREGLYPVAWQFVDIDPESTERVRLSYRWPDAVTEKGIFNLTLWPQATARPDTYELSVSAPSDHAFVTPGGLMETSVTFGGVLKEPLTVSLRVVPSVKG